MVNRAKMLHALPAPLVGMAKAMLSRSGKWGTDPQAAIEQTIGWQRLEALSKHGPEPRGRRADNLAEVDRQLSPVHRTADDSSSELSHSAHGSDRSFVHPLDVLHSSMHRTAEAAGRGADLISDAGWRKLIGIGATIDVALEVAVVVALRNRLRPEMSGSRQPGLPGFRRLLLRPTRSRLSDSGARGPRPL